MSRIGKLPVAIPDKVEVSIQGTTVSIKGPKGSLTKEFAPVVDIASGENEIIVTPSEETRFSRAMQGTVRSIINGMVTGVTEGFTKSLEINGVVKNGRGNNC